MTLEELQDRLGEKLLDLNVEQLKRVCIRARVSDEREMKRHLLHCLINESIDTAIKDEGEERSRSSERSAGINRGAETRTCTKS